MSQPVLFLRHRARDSGTELDDVVTTALLREAQERLARGERLVDGRWQTLASLPHARARQRSAARRKLFEGLLFWAAVGTLGLAFVGLTLLLV